MGTPSETVQEPPAAGRQRRLRALAIIPAYNEQDSIATVLEEIRVAEPDLHVVVVNDASFDGTAAVAARTGAVVLNLPFNIGIGGAMPTGDQYAPQHGFQLAIPGDGDGQQDPRRIRRAVGPIPDGRADPAVGTPLLAGGGDRGQ